MVVTEARSSPETWVWARQAVWSRTADQLKRASQRARMARLVLTAVGSALVLMGSQLSASSEAAGVVVATLGGCAMAGVAFLGGRRSLDQIRQWTRARSVSEALKTQLLLFLTSAGSYSGQDRSERLDREAQRLEREAGELQRFASAVPVEERPLPAVRDLESYVDLRVRRSQIVGYYEPRARLMRRRFGQFRALEIGLAVLAASLAGVAAVAPSLAAWAAVVATMGGTVAAFAAGERYELLWVEYERTASELRRLADRRTDPAGEPLSAGELIVACEAVISVQNQGWMAAWGKEITDSAGGPSTFS